MTRFRRAPDHDRTQPTVAFYLPPRLAHSETLATARLIAALAELDARRLYLGQGCSSMFTNCTQVLHLASEQLRSPRVIRLS